MKRWYAWTTVATGHVFVADKPCPKSGLRRCHGRATACLARNCTSEVFCRKTTNRSSLLLDVIMTASMSENSRGRQVFFRTRFEKRGNDPLNHTKSHEIFFVNFRVI